MLVFLVAVPSPEIAKDWSQVERLCERTVRSLLNQTDPAVAVYVACNQAPKMDIQDERLRFVEEDFPLPERNLKAYMNDKWKKIHHALVAARQHAPAHFMIADCDDYVSNRLGSWLVKHPEHKVVIMQKGWIHDLGSNKVLKTNELARLCGTSSVMYLEPDEVPQSREDNSRDFFILANGHTVIAKNAREAGLPTTDLPFPGVVYLASTGENASGIRLTDWKGKRALLKKLLHYRPLTRSIREEFSLQ